MSVISEAEKAKVRKTRYAVGSAITLLGPALAAALLYGGVDKWAALAIAALSLLTGSATNLQAAQKTKQQINDGKFDQSDPVQVANDALKQIADKAALSAGDLTAVTQAAASVLPGLIIGGASAVEKAIADAVASK